MVWESTELCQLRKKQKDKHVSRECSVWKMSRLAQQAGFLKARYAKRTRNETKEFRAKQGPGDRHCQGEGAETESKQLYYTFSRE